VACFKKAAGGWVKLPQLLQIVAHETRDEAAYISQSRYNYQHRDWRWEVKLWVNLQERAWAYDWGENPVLTLKSAVVNKAWKRIMGRAMSDFHS
jgi:hypothetical protein